MILTIGRRIQLLTVIASLIAALAGSGGWLLLQEFSLLQDEGARTAVHAQDAIEASQFGARLYRIIADAEINRAFDDTEKDWATATAAETQLVNRIDSWTRSDDERQLAKAGRAALAQLHAYFEKKMLPALRTIEEMTDDIRAMDGDIDRIVDEVVDNYTKLKDLLIGLAQSRDKEFDAAIGTAMAAVKFAVIGLFVILAGTGMLVGRSIVRPIARLNQSMLTMADGSLDLVIGDRGRRDEIGEISRSLERLRIALDEAAQTNAERASKSAAERDRLQQRATTTERFTQSIEELGRMIARSSDDVASAAQLLTSTADATRAQVSSVTQAAEETSANVSTAASGAEELASAIREINQQVTKSAAVAGEAAGDAELTVSNVKSLTEAAGRIGDVVKLIQDIAEQTNLLALNATIESARAGEAGRGFAVVASEVKQLAGQTARATGEITAKIQEIQAATHDTASSIGRIILTIESIREMTSSIAGAVEEQGAATGIIAESTQKAALRARGTTATISDVGAATEKNEAAAVRLSDLSTNLQGQSAGLHKAVVDFVREMQMA